MAVQWGCLASCCVRAPAELPALDPIVADRGVPVGSAGGCDGSTLAINGGATACGNLFHSFERFSAAQGITAFFNYGGKTDNIMMLLANEYGINPHPQVRGGGWGVGFRVVGAIWCRGGVGADTGSWPYCPGTSKKPRRF
ncbi:MAG: filamentous hemagglutinin N-terminal domain-containing protein [Oscillatoria princeps RMCB-10]|nr:filamentous hemagglutinin N-terminal domain-containing protein [Oscillatoria princeps RMCB-10]